MFRSNQRREGMTIAIFGLWRNWAVAVGFSYDADYARPYSAQAVAGTDQHSLLYSFAMGAFSFA